MKEKLIIKNFGPIKNVELELDRFNVLIGENATGKSTVAKVLAVCRYFSYIRQSIGILDNPFEDGLSNWGLSEFAKDGSFVFYECSRYSFTAEYIEGTEVDPSNREVSSYFHFNTELISLNSQFKNLLSELEKIKSTSSLKALNNGFNFAIPHSFFQNDVKAIMNNPFYLHTERGLQSIFSLGKHSMNNLSDALYNQLANIDKISREFENEILIKPLSITYKNQNGKGYIKKEVDDRYYSLFNAASGYHSAIPIVLVVENYSELRKKPKTFIIEEPELNLFPTAQNKLMQYLVDKTMNYGNSTLLTTHSPYILTSLNNLMFAYNVGKKYSEEADKIIEKKYWINPDDVSVYMMLPNGECEDIFDREEGLIKAEKIDGVTNILNEQFSELLNLEFAANEFNT